MYIHQVPYGTEFTFTFDENTVMSGNFDGNKDHMAFYITCPEISRNVDKYIESEPKVEFIINDMSYIFDAKFLGVSDRKDAIYESLEFRITTPFKEVPLRKSFRIQIGLKVRLHEYVDDYKKLYSNGWLCDAVSDDMSKNGICLWCDYNIQEPIGTMFTLEFSLKTGILYMIPSKLVRAQPNTVTRSYNYDYGFVFDFTGMPDKQEKLLLDILEHKIKNRL